MQREREEEKGERRREKMRRGTGREEGKKRERRMEKEGWGLPFICCNFPLPVMPTMLEYLSEGIPRF